jgi:hypothetical protein
MKITEDQIRELAGIFDDIITSDSDAVKSAFHRLAFLSSLAQHTKEEPGPFTDMVTRLDWMEREMIEMKRDIQILQNNGQTDMFTDSPADITLNYPSTSTAHTMIGAVSPSWLGNITLQPLTSNDIVSLGTVDISTIKLTNGIT